MRIGRGWLVLMMAAGLAKAQTPAAPAPPPTIQNSTQVPAAPVSAHRDAGTAGEMPMDTPREEPRTDQTPAASPVPPAPHGAYLMPGTRLQLRLLNPVTTGQQRNGDIVRASLLVPVRVANGHTLQAGTPAEITVLSAAAAGTIQSYGVLSLQVVRVGGVGVYSSVLDFNGKEGAKILADSAPAKGTEARVSAGTVLRFRILGAGNQLDPDSGGKARPTQGKGGNATPPTTATGSAATAPGTSHGYGVSSPAPQAIQPH